MSNIAVPEIPAEEVKVWLKKLQSLKFLVFQESPDFQKFLEPSIMELNRTLILESRIYISNPYACYFLQDTRQKRFQFLTNSIFFRNVFALKGLGILEKVTMVISRLEAIKPTTLERMLWLRKLFCFLTHLASLEFESSKKGKQSIIDFSFSEPNFGFFNFVTEGSQIQDNQNIGKQFYYSKVRKNSFNSYDLLFIKCTKPSIANYYISRIIYYSANRTNWKKTQS